MQLRNASNADSEKIVQLIDNIFREYGDRVCLEKADADLLALETNYGEPLSHFYVLEDEGKVCGCVAALRVDNSTGTIRRFYLAKELRGSGWGERLFHLAVDWCRNAGLSKIEFWSDTHFHRAHRFFERNGFRKGETRDMDDSHEPYQEYRFTRIFG